MATTITIVSRNTKPDTISQSVDFLISDGVNTWMRSTSGITVSQTDSQVQSFLDGESGLLLLAAASDIPLTQAQIDFYTGKTLLQAAKADAAVTDINNMLANLQPVPWGALTTAQKTELIRTTLISILQYERTIIKWAKQQIS